MWLLLLVVLYDAWDESCDGRRVRACRHLKDRAARLGILRGGWNRQVLNAVALFCQEVEDRVARRAVNTYCALQHKFLA